MSTDLGIEIRESIIPPIGNPIGSTMLIKAQNQSFSKNSLNRFHTLTSPASAEI